MVVNFHLGCIKRREEKELAVSKRPLAYIYTRRLLQHVQAVLVTPPPIRIYPTQATSAPRRSRCRRCSYNAPNSSRHPCCVVLIRTPSWLADRPAQRLSASPDRPHDSKLLARRPALKFRHVLPAIPRFHLCSHSSAPARDAAGLRLRSRTWRHRRRSRRREIGCFLYATVCARSPYHLAPNSSKPQTSRECELALRAASAAARCRSAHKQSAPSLLLRHGQVDSTGTRRTPPYGGGVRSVRAMRGIYTHATLPTRDLRLAIDTLAPALAPHGRVQLDNPILRHKTVSVDKLQPALPGADSICSLTWQPHTRGTGSNNLKINALQ